MECYGRACGRKIGKKHWFEVRGWLTEIVGCLIMISNCQGSLVLDVLQYAKYEPQVLQVELHPLLTQESLVTFCKAFGIAVTAYSSFGPQSYVELGMGTNITSLFDHNLVKDIAATHKKSMLFCLHFTMVLTSHSTYPSIVAMGYSTRYRCHSEE